MALPTRRRALSAVAIPFGAALLPARTRAQTDAPARVPDVVYVPTPDEVVAAMLAVARVGPRDGPLAALSPSATGRPKVRGSIAWSGLPEHVPARIDHAIRLFGCLTTTARHAEVVPGGEWGSPPKLDAYETWQDNAPEANPGNVVTAMQKFNVIANGADVILTVGTADLTAGVVDFHAFWMPLSNDGNVVAA